MRISEENTAIRGLECGKTPGRVLTGGCSMRLIWEATDQEVKSQTCVRFVIFCALRHVNTVMSRLLPAGWAAVMSSCKYPEKIKTKLSSPHNLKQIDCHFVSPTVAGSTKKLNPAMNFCYSARKYSQEISNHFLFQSEQEIWKDYELIKMLWNMINAIPPTC